MYRPTLRRAAFAVALVAGVASLGACSGGPSIPKPEYLSRANAYCDQQSKEFDKLVLTLPVEPLTAREKYVVKKLAPALTNVVNGLRSLGAPEGDAEYLESIYADVDKEIAKMVDQPSTDLVAKLDRPFAVPARRLDNYGLDRCADF